MRRVTREYYITSAVGRLGPFSTRASARDYVRRIKRSGFVPARLKIEETKTMITTTSSDTELMKEFDSLRAQACGEAIGERDQKPAEAVAAEGWKEIRRIYSGTNVPGQPVFAEDLRGRLYVVADLDGPWAIQVAEGE